MIKFHGLLHTVHCIVWAWWKIFLSYGFPLLTVLSCGNEHWDDCFARKQLWIYHNTGKTLNLDSLLHSEKKWLSSRKLHWKCVGILKCMTKMLDTNADKTELKGAVKTILKRKCFSGIKTPFSVSTYNHCCKDVTLIEGCPCFEANDWRLDFLFNTTYLCTSQCCARYNATRKSLAEHTRGVEQLQKACTSVVSCSKSQHATQC